VSTSIEWDDRIPPLAVVQAEAARARQIFEAVHVESDARPNPTAVVEADHRA
jgi:uncharacterized protein (UPF0276 family)